MAGTAAIKEIRRILLRLLLYRYIQLVMKAQTESPRDK